MKKTYFKAYSNQTVISNPLVSHFFSAKDLKEAFIIEYQANELIQKDDQPLAYLYLIIAGKAKIIKNQANGKRLILQFLEKGDFIGDLTIVGAEEMAKDVVSIGTTVCLALPLTYVEKVLLHDNDFLRKISRYIGHKLLKRTEHFSNSQTYDLKYRLAELILLIAEEGIYRENQAQIAEYLGVSYRHLLFTLKEFRDQGLLTKVASGDLVDQNKMVRLLGK